MLTREEGERLAAAMSCLRPDWPTKSLFSFIGSRKERPYRDLALELVYVALDPKTQTPARIDQDGPWKQLTRVANPSDGLEHINFDTACTVCLKPFEHLWHGGTGTVHDHEFTKPHPSTLMPTNLRETLNRKQEADHG